MTFPKFSKISEILSAYMTPKYCAAGENFEDFIVRNDDFPIENSTISRWNQKKRACGGLKLFQAFLHAF